MLKLGNSQIPPRPSPAPSECTGTTASPPTLEGEIAGVYRTYNNLKAMGGRPSASINRDPGPCDPSKSDIGKEYHVSDHWERERIRLRDELERWRNFRKHQKQVRRDSESFEKYIEDVSEHIREAGIEWTVQLQRRPGLQRKLDEWKEYYIYEQRRHCNLKKELARIQQLPESKRCNGRLWSAEEAVEKLEPVLDWIKGQFPEIEAELAVWWGRLRPRKETAMTKDQTIWQDKPRQRRGIVIAPLEGPRVKGSTGKPKGIVKQSGRNASKKKRQAATKSSRQEADWLPLSSIQSLSNESCLQAIAASVAQVKKKINKRRQSSCQASAAESSPRPISASVRGMKSKRRQSPGQVVTAQPQGVRKDRNIKRGLRASSRAQGHYFASKRATKMERNLLAPTMR